MCQVPRYLVNSFVKEPVASIFRAEVIYTMKTMTHIPHYYDIQTFITVFTKAHEVVLYQATSSTFMLS